MTNNLGVTTISSYRSPKEKNYMTEGKIDACIHQPKKRKMHAFGIAGFKYGLDIPCVYWQTLITGFKN